MHYLAIILAAFGIIFGSSLATTDSLEGDITFVEPLSVADDDLLLGNTESDLLSANVPLGDDNNLFSNIGWQDLESHPPLAFNDITALSDANSDSDLFNLASACDSQNDDMKSNRLRARDDGPREGSTCLDNNPVQENSVIVPSIFQQQAEDQARCPPLYQYNLCCWGKLGRYSAWRVGGDYDGSIWESVENCDLSMFPHNTISAAGGEGLLWIYSIINTMADAGLFPCFTEFEVCCEHHDVRKSVKRNKNLTAKKLTDLMVQSAFREGYNCFILDIKPGLRRPPGM